MCALTLLHEPMSTDFMVLKAVMDRTAPLQSMADETLKGTGG